MPRFLATVSLICGIGLSFPFISSAANLDQLHGPLVGKGDVLSTSQFSYLWLREDGLHGSAAFQEFQGDPEYPSVREHLRFSPFERLELHLGYGKDYNANYERSTNATTTRHVINQYDLDFFHHFYFSLRRRFQHSEIFLNSYGNRQKSSWNVPLGALAVAPDFFTVIRSHYEDVAAGWRYLTATGETATKDNLSLVAKPLLNKGQWHIESQLGYKRGKIDRANQFYAEPPAIRNYFHDLTAHLEPQVLVGLGIRNDLEFRTGLAYELPHRFKFDFQQINTTLGTDRFISAEYKIEKKVRVPFRLNYRPLSDAQIGVSADTIFAEQTLESSDNPFNNASPTIVFPKKRLRYLNVKPTLELLYLLDAGKEIEETPVNKLTKRLLKPRQLLAGFQYVRDITHLRKNGANGTANLAEYESNFLFPLDNFVSGSEYAAHFTGNSSGSAPDISPQNYHQVEVDLKYGLLERLNAGLGVGHRSESGVHQFVFANNLTSRSYKFKPYTYFNFFTDWQPTLNSLLTLRVHYVPQYTTFMKSSADPKEYEGNTEYTQADLAFHILF